MSVQLDPRQQPVNRITSSQDNQPVIPHQRRLSFGDTLEVRQEGGNSFFDCFKNCFQAILDFFKRLFSKESPKEKGNEGTQTVPAQERVQPDPVANVNDPHFLTRADAQRAREVPEPKFVEGFTLNQEFLKDDLDFGKLRTEHVRAAEDAEHDCSFPKLAVYLMHAFDIGLMEAVKRINAVSNKHPNKNALTPLFVMQYY